MSSGDIRKVSRQDIQLVQNLIERCLQLYMSQKEVVGTLLQQAKIEPGFTELVWQKLEEENQEFFEAYHLRLVVKEQIIEFNKLLEKQAELMHQIRPIGAAPLSISNGSHMPQMHQNAACFTPEQTGADMKSELLHQSIGSNLSNAFSNGMSSLHPCMQPSVDMSIHARRLDSSPNMFFAQNSNLGMVPTVNGGIMKTEPGYAGSSQFIYGANGNVLEARPTMGDPSISSFGSVESNSQNPSETILDPGTSSFGFLGQIPRNFSLSDLTADFSNTDILESFSRSPFLATDGDNFLDPNGRTVHQEDMKRLDTISEGLSYEDFGSD